ncbi:MAG: L,D-transpeptidase family protein, partial [Pseudomonadota bacterium]
AFSRFVAARAARVSAGEDVDHIELNPKTLLKPGRTSEDLPAILTAIGKRGSDALKSQHAEAFANTEAATTYGPDLVALVEDFQKETKLTPDGIIGPATIRALTGHSNADKIARLELAMERLRWLPRDFGDRHVFINQPAYRATYRKDGEAEVSMRVVVGKKSNQTTFFYDEIETVEYNPYWGVPLSIIVNEMMPKLAKDPSYLDRAGYEVTTLRGSRVSSASVDWYGVATRSRSINVRQPPGPKNALGELKILFPNKHAIYMHDTPAKRLFKKDRRAYSHGCIRLEDPRLMAAAVLGTNTDHIASQISKGKNLSEKVGGNVAVYSAYFTAWPTADGPLGYYDDVYGRDKALDAAMTATVKARSVAL